MFAVYGNMISPDSGVNLETENSMANALDEALAEAANRKDTLHDFSKLFEENYFQNTLNEINDNAKVAPALAMDRRSRSSLQPRWCKWCGTD